MNDDKEQRMMSEEYGKDFSGCIRTVVVIVAIIAIAAVILFT